MILIRGSVTLRPAWRSSLLSKLAPLQSRGLPELWISVIVAPIIAQRPKARQPNVPELPYANHPETTAACHNRPVDCQPYQRLRLPNQYPAGKSHRPERGGTIAGRDDKGPGAIPARYADDPGHIPYRPLGLRLLLQARA